ncbi:adenylate/guanylate cyclase domain-containing protein [Actinobacteria bacterium YIM 96077]|uniref:Adenylate/guanylate cyclase domain-containing protein n=1 Tax=Phytoactinopolyspora halophila TaxID=1981511 RepID=A0A329QJK2_9ACTN|nr:adenylate/guanylate cyclase domain-containing protein [Phytoactinopolyspora halophila]AYY14399.1 adenylate/guanylate cyclase domain-containing protein [Actinobacteria bacterium YIM 96077]RAW11879.1 adenylate/guanylate cyclase domain-containing protein [Phytoactinopolyspora halophila]
MTNEHPTQDELEQLLLGASRRYTFDQIAEAAGLPVDEARRYWRALGFPDVGDEKAFTVWDLEALRGVRELIDSEAVDRDTAVQMVRALGRMTGRLAEWHVETLAEIVEENEATRTGAGSRLSSAYDMAQRLLPEFERLLIYAWRRKLASSVNRLIAIAEVGESPLLAAPASVGFADLVSFTRLSRGMSVEALGELVEKFEATTNDIIFGCGGRVVKTLGDEVVFVADTPLTAATIGCQLVEQIGPEPKLPDIRVGIATGPVVARLGDVFGTPTNLAARLTAVAERNSVLVDSTTAEALEEEPSVALRALPPISVRGIGPVEVYTVSPRI